MLRSSIQLVKSHGDDLGLEYLWNGNFSIIQLVIVSVGYHH